jgi:hypothetical protein
MKAGTMPAKIKTAAVTKSKETIYIDVDDEITSIIEKLRTSKGTILALVLPKRATMLQSIVNMKLLKRAADDVKKNLVLITTEKTILPLAGSVGLHVATTPTSRPAIPAVANRPDDAVENISEPIGLDDEAVEDFDSQAQAATPIGALAAAQKPASLDDEIEETEAITMPEEDTVIEPSATDKKPVPKDKKLAVPSFDLFKKRIALGVLAAILLVAAWVLAFVVLPKATVTVATETRTIDTDISLTLDTAAKTLDSTKKIVPATAFSLQKSYAQQVSATGQQNNGEKATGKITVTNCTDNSITVPAGTSFTKDNKAFLSAESMNVPGSNFTSSGTCKEDGKRTVNVTAVKAGAAYNLAPGTYSFSGSTAKVSAYGSAMTGGTDDITKVVAQSDIDTAKEKITTSQDVTAMKQSLQDGLKGKGVVPIPSTYLASEPQITSSAQAGDKADTVTVNAVVTYNMLGAMQSDLEALVKENVQKEIGNTAKASQKIIDFGLKKATFAQDQPATKTSASVGLKTRSVVGPELSIAALKQQVAGKKSGQIKQELTQIEGVTDVKVAYSPFWVSSVPKNVNKITVTLD